MTETKELSKNLKAYLALSDVQKRAYKALRKSGYSVKQALFAVKNTLNRRMVWEGPEPPTRFIRE